MRYGEHLKANIAPEYGPDPYLDYHRLDEIISELMRTKPGRYVPMLREERHSLFIIHSDYLRDVFSRRCSSENIHAQCFQLQRLNFQPYLFLVVLLHTPIRVDETNRALSMTAPPHTDAQGHEINPGLITEETFLRAIDNDMVKVEQFTLSQVSYLRNRLDEVEQVLKTKGLSAAEWLALQADEIANDFLRLEKYVNINFMGFHKILKKHDKHLPDLACKCFYVNRLSAQAWVRGDYSDIVVRLSAIYSALRNDHACQEKQDASQSFLRNTSKYWVKTEDVSRVKYMILKHLPVFLQKTNTGESDSQFTNSVYLDNAHLELYHGRLDKRQGAINLRLRWYGPGDPTIVFVERKTHNDKWTGLVSIKERFVVRRTIDLDHAFSTC